MIVSLVWIFIAKIRDLKSMISSWEKCKLLNKTKCLSNKEIDGGLFNTIEKLRSGKRRKGCEVW